MAGSLSGGPRAITAESLRAHSAQTPQRAGQKRPRFAAGSNSFGSSSEATAAARVVSHSLMDRTLRNSKCHAPPPLTNLMTLVLWRHRTGSLDWQARLFSSMLPHHARGYDVPNRTSPAESTPGSRGQRRRPRLSGGGADPVVPPQPRVEKHTRRGSTPRMRRLAARVLVSEFVPPVGTGMLATRVDLPSSRS